MTTAPSSRQIRKSEQKQKSLIDAAKFLFGTKGYAGTTIDDIAEQADVAKVTVYAYFKSKEEIALRIKRLCAEECISYTEALIAENLSVDEMMNKLAVDIAEWTEQNWRLLDVFCSQRFSPLLEQAADQTTSEPMVICLNAIIQLGQKTGRYRKDFDSTRVAKLLDLAILSEQYHWVQSGRGKNELQSSLERCFDFVLRGMLER